MAPGAVLGVHVRLHLKDEAAILRLLRRKLARALAGGLAVRGPEGADTSMEVLLQPKELDRQPNHVSG